MGRPLRKDVFGTDVIGTYVSDAGVKVEFYDSELRTDGIVIKQRGAKTFVVAQVGTPTVRTTAVLKNGEPSAAGEMRIRGYNSAGSGQGAQVSANLVSIAKITKRVATDFSGNRYTWFLENDSSADYIVLTPITTVS
jgi:hypothetical protein